MIHLVFGKNSFFVYRKYKELLDSFSLEDPNAHRDVFDCDEGCEIKDLQIALCSGGGLFSQKKCIAIKNIFQLNASRQEDAKRLLEDASKDANNLIVVAEFISAKPTGKLMNFLKKNARVEICELLEQRELKAWIQEETKKRSNGSVSISLNAVQRFWEMSQGNMWTVNGDIDKLINYKENGEISLEEVELLCRGEVSSGIFDLVDSIGTRNKERAIELKNRLIIQGENEFYLFSMIISQFRNLTKVMECVEKGVNDPAQIGQRCSMHPFVVRKTLAQLRGYNKRQLKNSFLLAAEIDQKTKSGDLDMSEALDYFIVKI